MNDNERDDEDLVEPLMYYEDEGGRPRLVTMAEDPENLFQAADEQGNFSRDMGEFIKRNQGSVDAMERARWGTVRVVTPATNESLLCMVHSVKPTSWIVQCLPDDFNVPPAIIMYRIEYGAGGAIRRPALVAPGMWICHGSDVQVIAVSLNLGVAQARYAAFITPAPGAIPNIP